MKKNFIIFVLILVLIPTFVASLLFSESYSYLDNNEEVSKSIKVSVNKNNEVKEIDLEDYIIGVVAGEMPASFEVEALKAQAVTSRTYAIYKMGNNSVLSSNTDDQVYNTIEEMKTKWGSDFSLYYEKIKSAVLETKGIVMNKDNKLFKSFYFAMSNGYTEDSETVFGETGLNSVSSPWDNESLNKFIVSTTFTIDDLKSRLNIDSISDINILNRDKTNRVSLVLVNDKEYTGIEFRKLLNLRSTDFTIEKNNNEYIITTKGYGHGVGMSQYGANGMAKEKYSYKEILKYYYNDIEFVQL